MTKFSSSAVAKQHIDMRLRERVINHANVVIESQSVYLDTETTGLNDPKIVEIAIIDFDGQTLLNSLVNPRIEIPQAATAIHGITDADVVDAPTFDEIFPEIYEVLQERNLCVYNLQYDIEILTRRHELPNIPLMCCAMQLYAKYWQEQGFYGDWKWQRLSAALEQQGITPPGQLHRAAADAESTRLLMEHLAGVIL